MASIVQCAALSAAMALLFSGLANAQALHAGMTLVLIDDAGNRSPPYSVLGGTIVISRNEPGHAAGNAAESLAPDRADIAFDPATASDKRLLAWIARSGAQAKAEITATGEKNKTTYILSGITVRSISVTQSQDGAGQTSLVLGAAHGAVDSIALN